MEAEYERLQQQPVPDSRMDGSASRPGQVRDESQQVAESYSGYQYRYGMVLFCERKKWGLKKRNEKQNKNPVLSLILSNRLWEN